MSPTNARLVAGNRVYTWKAADGTETDVLSVTTIRKMCGLTPQLVEWQLGNVTRLAMGTKKVTTIGPRGGVKTEYVQDGPFPGEFVNRILATDGDKKSLAAVKAWLRAAADEPRDIAAIRGLTVHKLIEDGVTEANCTDAFLTTALLQQLNEKKSKRVLGEEDILFVRNCIRQYWDMREHVPFKIIAQEPQVWNLTHGYAGSFDALVEEPDGTYVLVDWKTSSGTYTDHAVQVTAYMAAEFVGSDGVIDERLTKILNATWKGALIHIRPNGWRVQYIGFKAAALKAFLGSCAFARYLVQNPDLEKIVEATIEGVAPDTEPSQEVDDDD